ncbi:MAG: hypothetical protein B7Z52_06595 [Burkholderiales bacterium 12-64-5]|nr:MAG: hypothetical protein B7Z52_06595 [Burkholderiales bacterium 12-64-5]
MRVDIFPAGQIGPAPQVMEQLRLGSLEMAVVHDGGISGTYAPYQVFSLPFIWENQAIAWKVLDGAFGAEMAEDMRRRANIRLLGHADNGVRHFTNSKRPIVTPDDMRGLKIRVQPAPVFVKLVESLAADPDKLAAVRTEFEALAAPYFADNVMHQSYLLTRARAT